MRICHVLQNVELFLFSVRLHDSIQDDGCHYLVFDL